MIKVDDREWCRSVEACLAFTCFLASEDIDRMTQAAR
jgi:hypothetical protein